LNKTSGSGEIRGVGVGGRFSSVILLAGVWAIGYFFLGARPQQTSAFDPSTALDLWIPFAGWVVWPYLLSIAGILLPAALVRSRELFSRTAVAYALAILLSFLVFYLLPTDATSLRSQAVTCRCGSLTDWAIDTLYAIDPPTNLLPSLHVSLATLAALAVSKEDSAYRPFAWIGWGFLVVSVCILKQHAVLDALSGMLLALFAFRVTGRAIATMRQPSAVVRR
jgi:hypothetical protein